MDANTSVANEVIAIGWDVRGWRSRDQVVAVAAVRNQKFEWLGISRPFQFGANTALDFDSLLIPAIGVEMTKDAKRGEQIIVAIDAPLAFPIALKQLLNGTSFPCTPPEREIDNKLAYRDCERWVANQFAKKPLSASFDKLGNNASLAICVALGLGSDGFSIVPQDCASHTKSVIEVYPGIMKRGSTRSDHAIEPIARHIPSNLNPGTDSYDAAICAILAAVHGGVGNILGLPDLVPPNDANDPKEGWIYGLPSEFVESHRFKKE